MALIPGAVARNGPVLAGFDLGQVEHIVDEREQMVPGT